MMILKGTIIRRGGGMCFAVCPDHNVWEVVTPFTERGRAGGEMERMPIPRAPSRVDCQHFQMGLAGSKKY